MNSVSTGYSLFPVSSERTFPGAPFPHKYIHCVVNDLKEAVHAVYALSVAGYDARNIHVMASWDFVEAIERKQQRQGSFARLVARLIAFLDEGVGDVYVNAARQGQHVMHVRLMRGDEVEPICNLLASHGAYLMKHVDTWTVTDLSVARAKKRTDTELSR